MNLALGAGFEGDEYRLHLDHVALFGEQFLHRPGNRGVEFGLHLVRLDLRDGLVFIYLLADLDEPAYELGFFGTLPHVRKLEIIRQNGLPS